MKFIKTYFILLLSSFKIFGYLFLCFSPMFSSFILWGITDNILWLLLLLSYVFIIPLCILISPFRDDDLC